MIRSLRSYTPSKMMWIRCRINKAIVLNIDRYERYIARYIVLESLPIWYKTSIFAHIPDILSPDILSDIRYPIWKPLIRYKPNIRYLKSWMKLTKSVDFLRELAIRLCSSTSISDRYFCSRDVLISSKCLPNGSIESYYEQVPIHYWH